VRAGEESQGRSVLSSFESENQQRPTSQEAPALATGSVGLLFVVLCVVGQLATGARDAQVVWFAKGSAEASRILAGEWWRCATALTLHADLAHALGNAASGWLLLEAVARRIGPGRTALLALLAGVGGNALTALVVRGHFDSIGASTAVFGVLGAATMLQAFLRVRRGWLVVSAGLALLGTLGTGEHADLFGHLFGFSVGAALGVLAVPFARSPKSRLWVDAALGALVLALLGTAWALALRGG
jgi:membrane associated rhomboid family serine protease